jgi:SAM-dependent methyltransferase
MIQDVPSPIDLRLMNDAQEWAATSLAKRPSRTAFFTHCTAAIESTTVPIHRILDLGSGPGFLAQHLLCTLPSVTYSAFDFSPAMHQLATERLGSLCLRVQFIEPSFRDLEWPLGLGMFECVVTHQAVHELRHKHHAVGLHQQVRGLLTPGGIYLVCDHFFGEDGMKNDQLYMTINEQRASLLSAGFSSVEQLFLKDGMVLHHAC